VSAIEFDHVVCVRDTRPVLRDVTFSVASGECVVLVGRSGAGKSTILRLINQLLLPDAGSIRVGDRDTRSWDPYELRRHTGFVLQEIALFPHLTVGENVGIVPRLLEWPAERMRSRVTELLRLVGLEPTEYMDRWPDQLSGGQRQRVGVARALAADPPVLLMDEPFGALDPITRDELRTEFAAIQHRLRKTIVLVTHDMREAFQLGDRIGVIEQGRLLLLGTPDALRQSDHPHVRRLLRNTTEREPRASPGVAGGAFGRPETG
jgi:osmoprotectant transport system ATP-binding protein